MKVVYIAGPFRGKNAWEVEQNIRRAEAISLECWQNGFAVLCPHTNTRFFEGTAPDKVWLEGYIELLKRCDAVLVVPDWEKSSGTKDEITAAHSSNIPVFYFLKDLLNWRKKTQGSSDLIGL